MLRMLIFVAVVALQSAVAQAKGKNPDGYVAVGLASPDFSYDIERKATDGDASDATLTYSPYIPLAATVELGIYGVSLGTSFDLVDDSEGGEEEKTKTTYSSYALSYYLDRIGLELSYVSLKGMNITSASGVDESKLSRDPAAHRNDILLTSKSANLWLAPLSFNLSLSDFFDPAAMSRGSGFGLVVVGSYDELDEKARKRIIPVEYSPMYGADASLMGGNFQSLSLHAGPAVVLEFYGFYLSGLATFGSGKQTVTYRSEEEGERSESRTSEKSSFYFAAGYKGSRVFTTVDYAQDRPTYDMHTVTLSTTRDEARWIVGVRF